MEDQSTERQRTQPFHCLRPSVLTVFKRNIVCVKSVTYTITFHITSESSHLDTAFLLAIEHIPSELRDLTLICAVRLKINHAMGKA